MTTVRKGTVKSVTGETFTGFISREDRLGAAVYHVYAGARLELHPYGRQQDDPLDQAGAHFFPQEVGAFLQNFGLLATIVNPALVTYGEEVPIRDLEIVRGTIEGTWFDDYGLSRYLTQKWFDDYGLSRYLPQKRCEGPRVGLRRAVQAPLRAERSEE